MFTKVKQSSNSTSDSSYNDRTGVKADLDISYYGNLSREECVCECGREICLPAVGQWRQLCAWLASQSVLSDVPEERWESGANDLFDLFSSSFHHIRVFHNKQTSSCSLCAGQQTLRLFFFLVFFLHFFFIYDLFMVIH